MKRVSAESGVRYVAERNLRINGTPVHVSNSDSSSQAGGESTGTPRRTWLSVKKLPPSA